MRSAALICATLALVSGCTGRSPSSRPDSPHAALDTFITALKTGDSALVLTVYHSDRPDFTFTLPASIPIESYRITKEIVLDAGAAKRRNQTGVVPPAQPGDVELQVEERIAGKPEMYSYWLRSVGGRWRIYAHAAWNAPD